MSPQRSPEAGGFWRTAHPQLTFKVSRPVSAPVLVVLLQFHDLGSGHLLPVGQQPPAPFSLPRPGPKPSNFQRQQQPALRLPGCPLGTGLGPVASWLPEPLAHTISGHMTEARLRSGPRLPGQRTPVPHGPPGKSTPSFRLCGPCSRCHPYSVLRVAQRQAVWKRVGITCRQTPSGWAVDGPWFADPCAESATGAEEGAAAVLTTDEADHGMMMVMVMSVTAPPGCGNAGNSSPGLAGRWGYTGGT